MADYFLLLDGASFEGYVRPALTESWRRRNFGPCRDLCASLLPAARTYAAKYHVGDTEPLLASVVGGLAFDRAIWRGVVAESLLFGATEMPELQTCPELLGCLLAPANCQRGTLQRGELPPILQAHVGSRDLTFGSAVYRPEHAGYNDAGDMARLAGYLASVKPGLWTVADLAGLHDVADEDKEDELAFAQEWFPVLLELFQDAHQRGRVIVHESIY